MPIKYNALILSTIIAIDNLSIRRFLLQILKNGSFQKKGIHQGDGLYKSSLDVGVDIYYTKNGGDVEVQEIVYKGLF